MVSFSAAQMVSPFAFAQGPFDTHLSHVDPKKLDSWIAVAADGTVTAYTGKCDFGQGMFTVQTQLVAEELCVPLNRVKLIQCDTSVAPDQGTTSGSQSTPTNFNSDNLAQAAATAREALIDMAAVRFGEPAGRTHGGRWRDHRKKRTQNHVCGAHRQQAVQPSFEHDRQTAVACAMDGAGKAGARAGDSRAHDGPI